MAAARTRRAARRAIWIAWTPAMAEWFRLASTDWTAPAGVHLTQGQRRQTLTARFTRPDGVVMTARLRLRRGPVSGVREVVDEELSMRFAIAREQMT